MKLKILSWHCGMMSWQWHEHVTKNVLPYKVSYHKIRGIPLRYTSKHGYLENSSMFETVPFLWKCNIFDGRYFIWKTDQCRLFTCATCIAACLFADTEKYTRRSGMSTCGNRREIENQVWSKFSFMPSCTAIIILW